MIDGPGTAVEVDESKFANYKFYRGKYCGDSSWIFGGIEKTDVFFAAR